jgi:hypothetical protein
MKVTREDLGCREGPGTYPFRDGTINIRQREIDVLDAAPRCSLYRERLPTVDQSASIRSRELRTAGGTRTVGAGRRRGETAAIGTVSIMSSAARIVVQERD